MKKSLVLVGVMLALSACSGNKLKVDTVREEKLDTDFVAENIKVTSKGCSAVSQTFGRECVVVSIDSTGTAPSNGGSTINRRNAMDSACANALANVRHWMGQRVDSNRFVERVADSTEISESKETQSSRRDEGSRETSNRENQNNTKIRVTNTIKQTASGFMEGWMPTDQKVVGPQEVSCTMSWSLRNTALMKQTKGL